MNAITYVTRLPDYTSQIKNLQLSVEYWAQMHAEAGTQKEEAWRMYGEAVDTEQPRATILDLYATACLFEDICKDTFAAHEEAKRQLLDLLN